MNDDVVNINMKVNLVVPQREKKKMEFRWPDKKVEQQVKVDLMGLVRQQDVDLPVQIEDVLYFVLLLG